MLEEIYHVLISKKTDYIMTDRDQALNMYFGYLPSGNRLSSISARTNRYKTSYVISAIWAANDSKK